jgi:hypothetical protein
MQPLTNAASQNQAGCLMKAMCWSNRAVVRLLTNAAPVAATAGMKRSQAVAAIVTLQGSEYNSVATERRQIGGARVALSEEQRQADGDDDPDRHSHNPQPHTGIGGERSHPQQQAETEDCRPEHDDGKQHGQRALDIDPAEIAVARSAERAPVAEADHARGRQLTREHCRTCHLSPFGRLLHGRIHPEADRSSRTRKRGKGLLARGTRSRAAGRTPIRDSASNGPVKPSRRERGTAPRLRPAAASLRPSGRSRPRRRIDEGVGSRPGHRSGTGRRSP